MATKALMLKSERLYPQNRRPERELINLAMGILTQAVRDLISPQKKVEKDWKDWQADSRAWFESPELHTGSFLWVCDVIGAEPGRMREWVASLDSLDRRKKKAMILSLIRLTYLRNNPRPELEADSKPDTAEGYN